MKTGFAMGTVFGGLLTAFVGLVVVNGGPSVYATPLRPAPLVSLRKQIVLSSLGQTTTVKKVLAWEHSGLDADGNPETLAAFDYAVSSPIVDMNQEGASAVAAGSVAVGDSFVSGTNYETDITALLSPLPSGDYRIWVRAVDAGGLAGVWETIRGQQGNINLYHHDNTPPAVTTDIEVRLNITVSGSG